VHRSTSWDAAKFEVCAHRYVDVSEPSFGVAVLNDGRYGHCVFDGAIRVSLARAAKYPDPTADHGRHAVTVGLLPHGAGLADVVAEAERLDLPVRWRAGGAAAESPPPLVEISGPGVEVDAVKPADDGSRDLVVRLHEALGDRTPVTVRCDRPLTAASRCDLLEDPPRSVGRGRRDRRHHPAALRAGDAAPHALIAPGVTPPSATTGRVRGGRAPSPCTWRCR
jgi:alpha-mannosidase